MYSRQHRTFKNSSNSSDKPAKSQFAPRPFAAYPPSEATPQQQQTPNLQTQKSDVNEYKSGLIDGSKLTPRTTPARTPRIQMKLTIGQPGDKYEQEADQMAQDVVQRINAPQSESVQRQETPEEELRMKPLSGTLGRQEIPEEGVQMKSMVQRLSVGGGTDATPDIEESIQGAKGSGQPLTENIKEPMERAFGADFSGVKVHTDTQSDQLNQSIQAKAFTTGEDVFFRQGEYNPGSRGGQELLAHELTHVVQQKGKGTEGDGQGKALLQRKIMFEKGTEYLNTEGSDQKVFGLKVPDIYRQQLSEVSKLEKEVLVIAEQPGSGSASYSYDEDRQKGIIKVGVLDENYDEETKQSVAKSKIIAMCHEMQHAIDDLKVGSPQEGRVRGSGPWYDKIMSELQAHAVQAQAGKEIMKEGVKISQNDEILASGFNEEGFNQGGVMYNKLLLYFKMYGVDLDVGMGTGVTEEEKNQAQVSQFIFLNWDVINALIEKVNPTESKGKGEELQPLGKRKRE
ncbi:hypothetical protein Cylst_5210 [Cylindrospermum stagnale PCC 7417]|uniref:eCIS core domain-containing protein n=1 Tax=Cylindrospermum stagnale PCC 7417 TaxID=56107 RepID=K9X3L7_9NOST|nr:DUF4157 domain-containing protein [Cylindrospermum stagnale]AFZ27245.1 hypothetical protein Cylst_5210 [Cylindrospermum stagnale PCC 7417]